MENENFKDLINVALNKQQYKEGSVLPGVVLDVDSQFVLVDVGLKSEGKIPLREFQIDDDQGDHTPKAGDVVRVSLQRLENPQGSVVLSREGAIQVEAWENLQEKYAEDAIVEGYIIERVRGGFSVSIGGAKAFLPNTQLDVRPVKNIQHLIKQKERFQILKMDVKQNNIVVSRRAVLDVENKKTWAEKAGNFVVDQEIQGTVKNLTDYGAFIELGGVDGLLHVTDMAWGRVSNPNEYLKVGETITLKILAIDIDNRRISLGLKQMQPNPWTDVANHFSVKQSISGTVTAVLDYGVFVDLGGGFEGLIHVSELSWVSRHSHPSSFVKVGDKVDVMILSIDESRHRIALSMKQLLENPWKKFITEHPEDSILEVQIQEINSYGMKIAMDNNIPGNIRSGDIDWMESGDVALKKYKEGDKITVKVLSVDEDRYVVNLGIKQVADNPLEKALTGLKVGDLVTATIIEKDASSLRVVVKDVLKGVIRRSELAKDRMDQSTDRFAVGEKIDACVTHIDKEKRLKLSIKQYEERIEKEAMAKYGHTDSGASLGDILGVALEKAGKFDLTGKDTLESDTKLNKKD